MSVLADRARSYPSTMDADAAMESPDIDNVDNYDDTYFYEYNFEEPMEITISTAMDTYVPPFLLALGTLGNLLIIVVLLNWRRCQLWSCVLLVLLAAVDVLLLYGKMGNNWIAFVWGVNMSAVIRNSSEVACQLSPLFLGALRHFSMWLVTLAVIDATVMRCIPHRIHKIFNWERIYNSLLVLLLFVFLVNAHVFWTRSLVIPLDRRESSKVCSFLQHSGFGNDNFRQYVWPIGNEAVSTILPGLIILSCYFYEVLSKRHYCKSIFSKICLPMTTNTISDNRMIINPKLTEEFTRMVGVIGVMALILALPESAYNMFEFILDVRDIHHLGDDIMRFHAQRSLAQSISFLSWDIFSASKCLVYLFTSAHFRRDAFRLIPCCCLRRARSMFNKLQRHYVANRLHSTDSRSSLSSQGDVSHTSSLHDVQLVLDDDVIQTVLLHRVSEPITESSA